MTDNTEPENYLIDTQEAGAPQSDAEKLREENAALRAELEAMKNASQAINKEDLLAFVQQSVTTAIAAQAEVTKQTADIAAQGVYIRNLRETPVSLTLDDADGGKDFRIRLKPRGRVGDTTLVTAKFADHHKLTASLGKIVEIITPHEASTTARTSNAFQQRQVSVNVVRPTDNAIRRIAIERDDTAPKGGKVTYKEDSGTSRAHVQRVKPIEQPPLAGSEKRSVRTPTEQVQSDLAAQKLINNGVMPPIKTVRRPQR